MNDQNNLSIDKEDTLMDAILTTPAQTVVRLEHGTVIGHENGLFLVRTDAGIGKCYLAASCLLQPSEGDTVLISTGEPNFVLAVLERESETDPALLRFPTGAHLHTDAGDLELSSAQAVSIAASEQIQVTSDELTLHADRGRAVFDRFDFFGNFVRSQMDHVKAAAEFVDTFVRDLSAKFVWSRRDIEEMDETHAGNQHTVVKEQLTTHGGDITTIAEHNVKIDADQIHLG